MSVRCPGGTIYIIQPGDTLFLLARRFGLTLEQLRRANPQITDPNRLQVGQEICIPIPVTRRRCAVMSPTDIAPNSEGVVYLNPLTGRVLVVVTGVPRPEQLPDGGVYKVYFGRRRGDTVLGGTMTEGLPGVWLALIRPPFSLAEISSILVTSERRANLGPPQGLGVATVIL